MDISMLKKLKSLEEENSKLKHLLADQLLDNKVLKELLSKNF
jgi:putative transposase